MSASEGRIAAATHGDRRLWEWARVSIWGLAGLILLYLILPTFVIVPLSFSSERYLSFPPPGWSLQWYERLMTEADYAIALGNSVKIGLPAALLATILGTLAAVAIVRGQMRAKRALSLVIIAPLILPQIVLAIGLFPIMARLGIIGSYASILIGHAIVCMPLVFITVTAALRSYSPSYELAAMTLGANWWNTFWNVTFPMIRVGVVVGFIFAFTFSFDEIMLAIFLTSADTRTMPRLLWEQLNYQMTPTVAAATVVILSITLALIAIAALSARRTDH